MPGEFLNLCSCRLLSLRREAGEIIAEIRCPVQEEAPEAGAEAGEAVEQRVVKGPAVKVMGQIAQPVPAKVLLQK